MVADYPVSKAIATGRRKDRSTTLGMRKPDGEILWAVLRAVPTRDPTTHEVNGAVATFFDITERKRFEDKLRHTQKLESLGVLAGGIAHDFNNLLVAILGNASLAREACRQSTAGSAPLLEEIESARGAPPSSRGRCSPTPARASSWSRRSSCTSAVREMAQAAAALIPKQVELHYQFQEGLPPIEADATQFRQVIMNLITNAAEPSATSAGRDRDFGSRSDVRRQRELDAYISWTPRRLATYVCVEVADTGSGMDEDTRARVFDPFFTTKFKGRGLGMAAALGIVRGHAGAIPIESTEGVGTKARVLLPPKANRSTSALPVRPANEARSWSSTTMPAFNRSYAARSPTKGTA